MAWGNKGHIVVAQVAKNNLPKSIIDSVNYYLNGMIWENAATWMNDIKKTAKYDYMLSWHGVTIARDKTYVSGDQPNVLNRIEWAVQVLKSRALYSREEVTSALLVLFHLVGDLHQPLNCGYPDDRGGRRTEVDFLGRRTNLYKVWETELIDEANIDQWDGAKINLAMSRADIAQIKYGNIVDWLDESREALNQVYDFKYNMITNEYITKNKILIAKQLVKGGMRLAYLLGSCFKTGSRCTF